MEFYQTMKSLETFFATLGFIFLVYIIFILIGAAITRWVFRINTIIQLLTEIRDKLTKDRILGSGD